MTSHCHYTGNGLMPTSSKKSQLSNWALWFLSDRDSNMNGGIHLMLSCILTLGHILLDWYVWFYVKHQKKRFQWNQTHFTPVIVSFSITLRAAICILYIVFGECLTGLLINWLFVQDAFVKITRHEGVRSLWSGLPPTLWVSTQHPS